MEPLDVEFLHPGHFIQEELTARGWTVNELIFGLPYPISTIDGWLDGSRDITLIASQKLGSLFQVHGKFFMNLQKSYKYFRIFLP